MNRRISRQVLDCGDGVRGVTALAVAALKIAKRAADTATPTQSGEFEDSIPALQDAGALAAAPFRFMAPVRVQSRRLKLSMNRSSESGRGLPHSKTQASFTRFRASTRSWTAPVLWRFGFRCNKGFKPPMRVQSWRLKLSLNRNAAQVFQPAGSGDFPVAQPDRGLESPLNPQSGKTALQAGSRVRTENLS
jgi:hypothetical protein